MLTGPRHCLSAGTTQSGSAPRRLCVCGFSIADAAIFAAGALQLLVVLCLPRKRLLLSRRVIPRMSRSRMPVVVRDG